MEFKKANLNTKNYDNIYVMSDIHGYYNIFKKMLKKIAFSENDLLIIIGDIIDRGPNNLSIIDYCFNHDNVVLLMGNHEFMMTSMLDENTDDLNNWIQYAGGKLTYNEFTKLRLTNKQKFDELLLYISELPKYMKIDINNKTYLLVHAGLIGLRFCSDINELLLIQGTNCLWVREQFLQSTVKTPFTIIFGHTPTYEIPYILNGTSSRDFYNKSITSKKKEIKQSKIWHSNNKIGIDCALYSGGSLACLRLNDMKEFYINK